jgi:hypothetical protein
VHTAELESRDYEALRVAKHSNWSDHHKTGSWPAYGHKVGRCYSHPLVRERKDRDCASKIDNAKDMTFAPTFSLPTLHMFEALMPLKAMLDSVGSL